MSDAIDTFLDHYHRRRPVNATFAGVHAYDDQLPDWSPAGLESLDGEMASLHAALGTDDSVDGELARGFLEIQRAELAGRHGPRGNPALWTGEAIFGVVSLMIRDFTTLTDRMRCASARLAAIPRFLGDARAALGDGPLPAAWTARALGECEGADVLLSRGMAAWVASAPAASQVPDDLVDGTVAARAAFADFADWLRGRPPAPDSALACGQAFYDLLLTRGHCCDRPRAELLAAAREALGTERARLDTMAQEAAGSWPAVQERLAADHPAPAEYDAVFGQEWAACMQHALAHDVVSWEHWPLRFSPIPPWTRDAAPYLYYLFYRSPAPFDDVTPEQVYTPLPAQNVEAHLRAWNRSVIRLNHVVHHGAIGHHVQNRHAYRQTRSQIGRIAAVDGASRIGMFCGGTMAEGWACYATALMEELGFLTPLERVSEQHSRVRFLARAVIDLELHQGTMTYDDAVAFWCEQVGASADAARGEVTKASMFPGTAIMYWLGTQGILELRERVRRARGSAFSLKAFHDELLGWGSIPVPMVARLIESAS